MSETLKQKTALVVGAGKGLGRQTAKVLASAGARVIAVSRTLEDLQSLNADMEGSAHHRIIAMDLMNDCAPSELLAMLTNEGIGIVVHNLGGTLNVRDPFCAATELRRVMRLNLEVAIDINAGLVPAMQKRGWGRVVHVSSVAAVARRGNVAYGVAQAALNAYTETIGRIVAADDVIISAIMPGALIYPGSHWESVARNRPADAERYLAERVATHKFASPQAVADFILYLCSNSSPIFAGAIIPVDGGAM
jgi:NAD(P)-dependent dehydrogenase (short-subunit alcohol dehydrogenase family)